VAWLGLILVAGYFVMGRADELASKATGILNPQGLPLLYVALIIVKICHEFGHSFACKKFGRDTGSGGEVHILGIMFLVFTPLPYVDASSSLALKSKWHRAIVGAAGMMVEMGIAAIAAIVWATTGESSPTVHSAAFNVVFIGSVSTLIFNGNPLLRYDGYYILSDLLEIPNLAQRSKDYLYYLVKRYVWSVKQARNPAHTPGEKVWMVLYAISSTIYRVFISVVILLFITDAVPFLGAILAATAVIGWGLVPLGKFVHYLTSNGELMRVRPRAILTSLVVPAVLIALAATVAVSDPFYVEGVVRPNHLTDIHAGVDGFLVKNLPSGAVVKRGPDNPVLVLLDNQVLRHQQQMNMADLAQFEARLGQARTDEPVAIKIRERQIRGVKDKIRRVEQQLADLEVRSPQAGQWISPELLQHAFVHRGQKLGVVATMDDLIIRSEATQDVAGILLDLPLGTAVEVRIKGRPDQQFTGRITAELPAGQKQLPSQALSAAAGGPIAVVTSDRNGTTAAEGVFEIQVTPDADSLAKHQPDAIRLLPEQRVIIRFDTPAKPLLEQGWRWLSQLLQRRFHI
jgi:putative peptide zinc metalloprotease protein